MSQITDLAAPFHSLGQEYVRKDVQPRLFPLFFHKVVVSKALCFFPLYSIQGSVELCLVPTASRQTIMPAGEEDLAAVCIAHETTRRNAMAMK